MILWYVRLIECEEGKKRERRLIVMAYDKVMLKGKLEEYYQVALAGFGVTYEMKSCSRLTFDIGDIAWFTKRMEK